MPLRDLAAAIVPALVALALPHGLAAETLKIASPIRGSWEGAIPELGMVVAGSAATVRERLAAYARDLGVGNLIAMLQIATLPADLTEKNLRLFARDVMPYLREGAEKPMPIAASA